MDTDYKIYDGAHVGTNCTDTNKAEFSYNSAVWLLGAAYMWNHVSLGGRCYGVRYMHLVTGD